MGKVMKSDQMGKVMKSTINIYNLYKWDSTLFWHPIEIFFYLNVFSIIKLLKFYVNNGNLPFQRRKVIG